MEGKASSKNTVIDIGEQTSTDELEAFRSILERMEQGILVWSAERVCIFVNSRYFELTGSSENDMFVGKTWQGHMNGLIEQNFYTSEKMENLRERMDEREVVTSERCTSSGRYISVTMRPLPDGSYVVSFTDITKAKEHEDTLAEALSRAKQAEVDTQNALRVQKARQAGVDRLSEFTDWLHSCKSLTELYEIVNQAMRYIYSGSSGQLFIYSNSRDVLDGVCSWGDSAISQNIQAQDCWSLRRGRVFEFKEGMIMYHCNHTSPTENTSLKHYYCLPLIANGDTVGLLHIDLSSTANEQPGEDLNSFNIWFATRCAEQISLAVANAQLRDELHEQSTRDPLTGLFNRRYFLERCRSEITRVKENSGSLGIVIFDADKFKTFNDHYGHDAGDAVLCHIADQAHKHFVDDDVVARVGGEEFAVMSLNRTSEELMLCLEEFRQQIASMQVIHYNKTLPAVSISLGYAMYPQHAGQISELIKKADAAMYHSKSLGRNCVYEASDKKAA